MSSVLMLKEERELVEYVKKVVNFGYPLTLLQLRLKVVEMIQCQPIPWARVELGKMVLDSALGPIIAGYTRF
jgi:hypothetical protein